MRYFTNNCNMSHTTSKNSTHFGVACLCAQRPAQRHAKGLHKDFTLLGSVNVKVCGIYTCGSRVFVQTIELTAENSTLVGRVSLCTKATWNCQRSTL